MERIYLSDWLYNASILGFLEINSDFWEFDGNKLISKDESLLKFGENYIEFDRDIFNGFSERYFNYAFSMYGRYNKVINSLSSYILDIEAGKDVLDIYKKFKNILSSFTLLKNKVGDLFSEKDTHKTLEILKQAMAILKEEKQEFLESDTKVFLGKIYGQKSFLNRPVTKNLIGKFYEDFEKPLKDDKVEKDKTYKCVICNRPVKKDTIFDTGICKFYGLNKDAKNFVWNFNTKLPICDICEIIYFSYFASFTKDERTNRYYFVNADSSVADLIKSNGLLKRTLKQEEDNKLINFFTEFILMYQHQKSEFILNNMSVLEIDISNETMPKVYAFNLSRNKAKFIKDNQDDFKRLSKIYYKINDATIYVLKEALSLFLENKIGFYYVYKLLKIYISSLNKPKSYSTNINPYLIQVLNNLIVGGLHMDIDEKSLWRMYHSGNKLAELFRQNNKENKIPSVAYKLLNALRISDVEQFMDILIRTYMAFNQEIPSLFVKTINDKNTFYAFGYSFLNGLLGKQKEVSNE